MRSKSALSAACGVALLLSATTPTAFADVLGLGVAGGTLRMTTEGGATLSSVTLDGSNRALTTTPSTLWTIVDARGTGATWTLTATATTPTSAAGSVDTVARTLPVANLQIAPGTVTALAGSDPATGFTASTLDMATSAQTLISSNGTGKGTYTLSPAYSLALPANAFRSNLTTGSGSSANPYTSTLTYTLA